MARRHFQNGLEPHLGIRLDVQLRIDMKVDFTFERILVGQPDLDVAQPGLEPLDQRADQLAQLAVRLEGHGREQQHVGNPEGEDRTRQLLGATGQVALRLPRVEQVLEIPTDRLDHLLDAGAVPSDQPDRLLREQPIEDRRDKAALRIDSGQKWPSIKGASVKLSHRYISGRQLPDKSVSLLDTASARVAIGQDAIPPAVEDCRRQIDHLKVEIGILDRENATVARHDERLAERRDELARTEARLAELERRWEQERALVEEILAMAGRIEQQRAASKVAAAGVVTAQPVPDLPKMRDVLDAKMVELRALQGDATLMPVCVDTHTIAEVIAGWTGIPVGKMLADEIKTVLNLKAKLEERIIGQSQALEAIAQRIRTARANLTDPRRLIGVFLLFGPSGVGKTETALALADSLYGGERNLVTLNMSEYQEAHTVSGLKGSPPGYVGYGEGGVLTEAVRRKPYCVVLLNEVEKAHPDVMELFYQVFDKDALEDAEGREIDFMNTVILLTSNVGTETVRYPPLKGVGLPVVSDGLRGPSSTAPT